MKENREKFSAEKMAEKLDDILQKYLSKVPQQVGLKLPKLKKVTNKTQDVPKIKLPKLKKVTA